MPTTTRGRSGQNQEPKLNLSLSYGFQGPKCLNCQLLPPDVCKQEAGAEAEELGLEPATAVWNVSVSSNNLIAVQMPE